MGDELTFIGTATTLLRLGPFTVLTDPNFLHKGERAYLGYGLMSRRRTEPAMGVEELPALDGIVLSHMHGDHWDRRAKAGLDRATPIVTTPESAKHLSKRDGYRAAIGLETWQEHVLRRDNWHLTVQALPGVHSTNPMVSALLPPVMGSLLELGAPDGTVMRRLYITGDTMPFEGFDEIHDRCPDIDVVIVHGGGTTLPGGFVVTMTGEQVVDCLRRISPRIGIPIHYNDYGVFKSGLDDIRRAVDAARLDVDIRYVSHGDTVALD